MAKILVVDDEPTERAYMRTVLEKDGHTITEAADGSEALESLSTNSFDIVITDILMPNVDGMDLIQEMLERSETYTPIIVVTGGGSGEAGRLLRSVEFLGVTVSLEKPVDPEKLTDTVRRVLEFWDW